MLFSQKLADTERNPPHPLQKKRSAVDFDNASYPVQKNPSFPDNFISHFPLTLAWLFKVGIERAEEAVNNSVGEAAGEFFQNIGEVPVST